MQCLHNYKKMMIRNSECFGQNVQAHTKNALCLQLFNLFEIYENDSKKEYLNICSRFRIKKKNNEFKIHFMYFHHSPFKKKNLNWICCFLFLIIC